MGAVVVVGASLAGLRAAQGLRAAGYAGDLIVVGDEDHLPYERPPLSKDFLLGRAAAADLTLVRRATLDGLGAQWLLGRSAVGLDSSRRRLRLDTNDEIEWSGVVIATGARARRLPFGHDSARVQVLRSVDDAENLRSRLYPGAHLVVIGGGFIGGEVAAAAVTLGAEVTIVEAHPEPFTLQLGSLSAGVLREVHSEQGAHFVAGVPVVNITGSDHGVTVCMADGRAIAASHVVVGVGATPNIEWLAGSGVLCDNGVVTDEYGRTSLEGVVAAGDVARYHSHRHGGLVRVEHWTNARDMPIVAANTLVAHLDYSGRQPGLGAVYDPQPYVWSEQYEHRIQIAGRLDPLAEVTVVDGAIRERNFAAIYRRCGETNAVLAWNNPKTFRQLRRQFEESSTNVRGARTTAHPQVTTRPPP